MDPHTPRFAWQWTTTGSAARNYAFAPHGSWCTPDAWWIPVYATQWITGITAVFVCLEINCTNLTFFLNKNFGCPQRKFSSPKSDGTTTHNRVKCWRLVQANHEVTRCTLQRAAYVTGRAVSFTYYLQVPNCLLTPVCANPNPPILKVIHQAIILHLT